MADTPSRPTRVLPVLVAAALAGVVAGAVAVYVMVSGNSNGDVAQSADCAGAVAAAERAAPFAKGEVAAFRVADPPRDLGALAFTDPAGKPVTLAGLGKASLVNIWATWCVPCRTEMPTLDRLEAALGGDGFAVVPVNIDLNATERATAFLEEIGVTHLPFYSEPSGALFKDLKGRGLAIGLPTTVLVDEKGCEIGVLEGPAEWDSEDAQALIRAATGA